MLGTPWKGYYLTAYGIAVKHGFKGTEADWLESLRGEKGENALLRYNAETDVLEWKNAADAEWKVLLSLSDLQTELEAATIEKAQAAKTDALGAKALAEEAAAEAKKDATAVASAKTDAQKSETNAKASENAAASAAKSAATSSANANGSAESAKKSEINAKASENAAREGASVVSSAMANAQKSAESAKKSETNAKASEGAAVSAASAASAAAERAAEEAAESAAQSVYEKLKFVDETGTVDLGDYARKEYVDQGDAFLKEYYDEPKETNIPYTQRGRFFTINSDTWDSGSESIDWFAEAAGATGGTINANARQDGAFKMGYDLSSVYSIQNETATLSLYYKINGEAVYEKNIQVARGEGAKESFTVQLKAGDVVEASFASDGYCEMRFVCYLVEEVKLYTPKVLAAEAIANKLFRLEGSDTIKTLEPPTGHEMFFYDHPLYEGFSCYADVPDFIMYLMFMVPNYPDTQPHYIAADNFALEEYDTYFAGGVCLLTYLGNYEWSAIALDAGLARKDLKNLPASVFKAKMIEAMPELDDVSSMMEALPDMEAVSSISKYISANVFSNLGEDQTIFVAEATHSLGDILQIIPSSVDLSGAYPAYVQNAGKSTQIKIYSSDGSLTDPTFVAGKPVRLVHNGMYYIVTV